LVQSPFQAISQANQYNAATDTPQISPMKTTDTSIAIDTSSEEDRKYRAPALEKGLDILELLARNGTPMTASQMASTLGRSVSELFRMVQALEFRGYIKASAEGRDGYVLTNKLFALGISQGETRSLIEVALPIMKELTHDLGQSCHLVVPSGDQIVVVGRVESPMDLGFSVRVGYRRRLIDTNSGLMLFGCATEESQQRWLPQLSASATKDEINRFVRKAKAAAEVGYIQAPSEFVDGVTDSCMPVIGLNGAAATVMVPFIEIKGQSASRDQVLEKLRAATQKIAEELGSAHN
jgi:DNA-binding IclR family transcriptional regulator